MMPISQFIDIVSRGFLLLHIDWFVFLFGIAACPVILIAYIVYCLDNPWKLRTYLMGLVFLTGSLLSLYFGVWAGVAGGYIK